MHKNTNLGSFVTHHMYTHAAKTEQTGGCPGFSKSLLGAQNSQRVGTVPFESF